jgi:hypothetical protein
MGNAGTPSLIGSIVAAGDVNAGDPKADEREVRLAGCRSGPGGTARLANTGGRLVIGPEIAAPVSGGLGAYVRMMAIIRAAV